MKKYLSLLFIALITSVSAQSIDTLTIKSSHFGSNRTVYIHTPLFYHLKSKTVKLPVIYILDGQHEWFVNPLLSTIEYLQYTHEIPQAILVVIPLEDRYKECAFESLESETLPLHHFITEEVATEIEKYDPNGINILVGHSFSASFSLYSYTESPDFYTAIFAHSPMDRLEALVSRIEENKLDLNKIHLSIGGIKRSKDSFHREYYNEVKKKHPVFFGSIHAYEANSSTHNAVPIVASPIFFSNLFEDFATRYSSFVKTDDDYLLVERPISVEDDMGKIEAASTLLGQDYPMELPELNSLASKYDQYELYEYAIALLKQGVELYPKDYWFHCFLGERLIKVDEDLARKHLNLSSELLEEYCTDQTEKEEMRIELKQLKKELKNIR